MKKLILGGLFLLVAIATIAISAEKADACWWLFGCDSGQSPLPSARLTVNNVCTIGDHKCTQTVAGCVVSDCVDDGSGTGRTRWQTFYTSAIACEVTGLSPSCWPSRVRR